MKTRATAAKKKTKKDQYQPPPLVHIRGGIGVYPPEFEGVVDSWGAVKSVGATASISTTFLSNSLLVSNGLAQSASVAKFASAYSTYRVMKYSFSVRAISNTTTATKPVWIAYINLASDPALSTAVSFATNVGGYPKTELQLLPCTLNTPNIMHHKCGYYIRDVVGSDDVLTDDTYTGAISSAGVFSDPSNATYFVLYYGLQSGSAFTAGEAPTFEIRLRQWVRFYDRRN